MELNKGGIFDKYGMIDNIITLLNDMEIKGHRNAQLLVLSVQGLEALKDGLKKDDARKEKQDGQDHASEREDV